MRLLRVVKEAIHYWYDDPKLGARDSHERKRSGDVAEDLRVFTKQVGISEELTLTDQGIQQIPTLLGSTGLPAAEGAPPQQFYDTRILERLGR